MHPTPPDPEGLPPAVLDDGGVYLPPSVAYALWRPLRELLARHRADGGHVRPEVAAALDALRASAHSHMCGSEQGKRTSVHDRDSGRLVTTGELAGRLGVTGFHVRRLAAAAGITRVAHGRWAPEDADRLAEMRRTR
ncbi:hypothetical protein [Streptomyces scabiei]|uniref:hypothetical protein n=1 Tax=Streptomyces scabiei TaxID=1930 RepID=UPI001B34188F|nr:MULTISPECIES: hypothetical protein [Streptomyces]MBP5892807.1 hypothetical protein [Streptomyces sp. LBUM 1481]MBP5923073.1 hypothetical protein [Streptomyces sp. LBUM 1483]MDX2686873.1 hypothetical protein [Streptomyces scabiei]MDX2753083.1 hypothetical protein [Streptomyces scabiei]MDX2807272.1 hypothetical protein [Streptomyces scabiei]